MAHLRVPGGEHVIELFEYLAPARRPRRRRAAQRRRLAPLLHRRRPSALVYDVAARARRDVVRLAAGRGRHGNQPRRPGALPARSRRDHGRAVPAAGGDGSADRRPALERRGDDRVGLAQVGSRGRAPRRAAEARPASRVRARSSASRRVMPSRRATERRLGDECVGIRAPDDPGERHHRRLGHDRPAFDVEVRAHPLGEDLQPLQQPARAPRAHPRSRRR